MLLTLYLGSLEPSKYDIFRILESPMPPPFLQKQQTTIPIQLSQVGVKLSVKGFQIENTTLILYY